MIHRNIENIRFSFQILILQAKVMKTDDKSAEKSAMAKPGFENWLKSSLLFRGASLRSKKTRSSSHCEKLHFKPTNFEGILLRGHKCECSDADKNLFHQWGDGNQPGSFNEANGWADGFLPSVWVSKFHAQRVCFLVAFWGSNVRPLEDPGKNILK